MKEDKRLNLEHVVATLLDEGTLGSFDLNGKKYADVELFVGAINPYELFLIAVELISAENVDDVAVANGAATVLYTIHQCAMIEEKIPAMIRSVTAMQAALAKALLVDRSALDEARVERDVIKANEVLTEAYETDVRPVLGGLRLDLGVSEDPLAEFMTSSERTERIPSRLGTPAGW